MSRRSHIKLAKVLRNISWFGCMNNGDMFGSSGANHEMRLHECRTVNSIPYRKRYRRRMCLANAIRAAYRG